MLLPLRTYGNTVTYNLIGILSHILRVEAGDLALPQALGYICKRIALATKTKDDFLAPVCPVFNAYV
jgi:hypothetical protein